MSTSIIRIIWRVVYEHYETVGGNPEEAGSDECCASLELNRMGGGKSTTDLIEDRHEGIRYADSRRALGTLARAFNPPHLPVLLAHLCR